MSIFKDISWNFVFSTQFKILWLTFRLGPKRHDCDIAQ